MEVRLLGPVEVSGASGATAAGPPRRCAVLAALAVTPGQAVPLDTLFDRVWGEQLPDKPREVLYAHISRLRRALREAAGGDAGPTIRRCSGGGYLLAAEPETVDLHRARQLAAQARALDDDESAADLLRRACQLWRGTPLTGVAGDWAARVRHTLEQELLATAADRFARELRLGHHAAIVRPLSELLAEHPLAEPLSAQLMVALYRSERQDDALALYRRLREGLAAQFGVEPGTELRQLHTQILRGDPELAHRPAPAAAADAAGADAGGTGGAAGAADPAGTSAAGAASLPVPAQLPPVVSEFTGRREPIAALTALLPEPSADQSPGLALLVGAAGVGKTALATRWAHGVCDRFPDGQLYANLCGYATEPPMPPLVALGRFLRALGLPAEQVPTEVEEAAALYRTLLAHRRVLVILDNAASADQVRPLLPGGAGCFAVVTSRDQLSGLVAREGAYRLRVDVFDPREAASMLHRLLGDRRAAAEPAALADLVELCGRLPLALRIAAANLTTNPMIPLADYAEQLRAEDRLGALAVPGDNAAAVRPAFGLSYQHLPPPARALFRRLGLIPGPELTLGAAAAVAETTPPQARELLAVLCRAHLLSEPAVGQFSWHDLVRYYARDRLAAEEPAGRQRSAQQRLFGYYLQTADAAGRLLLPHLPRLPLPATAPAADPRAAPQLTDDAAALAWFDSERVGLVAAVLAAAPAGPLPVAYLLADALTGYFWLRNHHADWQAVAEAALSAATRAGDPQAQAAAAHSLALQRWRHHRYSEAVRYADRAQHHARLAGWAEGEAAILRNLGAIYSRAGRLAQASVSLREALRLDQRDGRRHGAATGHFNLALVAGQRGQLVEAVDHAERALAAFRRLGVGPQEGACLAMLGDLYCLRGQLALAREALEQARSRFATWGNRASEGGALRGLATVARTAGELTQARELAEAALTLTRDSGRDRITADCLVELATVQLSLGELPAAAGGYRRAIALARRLGDPYVEVEALLGLAGVHQRRGVPAAAHRLLRRAGRLADNAGFRLLTALVWAATAEYHLANNGDQLAADHAARALTRFREIGHRPGELRALTSLAAAADRSGDRRAMARLRQAAAALRGELAADAGAPGDTCSVAL